METRTKKQNRPIIVRESLLLDLLKDLGDKDFGAARRGVAQRKIANVINGFRFSRPQPRTKPIVVTVEGGCIQHIENPYNVEIIVKDYDTDGCDGPNMKKDSDGTEYFEGIW